MWMAEKIRGGVAEVIHQPIGGVVADLLALGDFEHGLDEHRLRRCGAKIVENHHVLLRRFSGLLAFVSTALLVGIISLGKIAVVRKFLPDVQKSRQFVTGS